MNTTDWFVFNSKNIILLQNALPVYYGFCRSTMALQISVLFLQADRLRRTL
jgi:hypothetical protein